MLRSRFESIPSAFSERLVPSSKGEKKRRYKVAITYICKQMLPYSCIFTIPNSYLNYFLLLNFVLLWQDDSLERKNIAKFSQMWNEFILSLRMEDLISHKQGPWLKFVMLLSKQISADMHFKFKLVILLLLRTARERDLLLVPYSSSEVSVIQWPPFLLASKVILDSCC